MDKPESIDHYLGSVPEDRRAALEKLRAQLHALVPGAQECISYAMPSFKQNGKVFAGFLATSKGCSYYPHSGSTLGALAQDLAGYSQTKSALHFDPARGLPNALLKKLVKTRLAEIEADAKR